MAKETTSKNANRKRPEPAKKTFRYKKQRNINIGIVVFCVILIYLVIMLVQYFVKPRIKTYEAVEGDISNESYYTGLILREEQVVNSGFIGYVNYFHREKQKAAVGNLIYTIDENGAMNDYLNASAGNNSSLTSENLKELKDVLASYSGNYSDSTFGEIYDINTSVNSMLMEYLNVKALNDMNAAAENISFQKCYAQAGGIIIYSIDGFESLTAEEVTADCFKKELYKKTTFSGNTLVSAESPVYKNITSDNWSIIIPLSEGDVRRYSDTKSVNITFTDKNIKTKGHFETFLGADQKPYGKIDVTRYMIQFASERYINISINDSSASGLKLPVNCLTEKEAYKIPYRFLTTGGESATEGFNKIVFNNDGTSTVEFVTATILREYIPSYKITDLYTENDDGTFTAPDGSIVNEIPEMTAEEQQALIQAEQLEKSQIWVDTSCFTSGDLIVAKDSDEQYQVAVTEKLDGVYNINHGYAVFKYVNVLDQNSDYVVVEKNVPYSIRTYDTIVTNAERVIEAQILR